MHPQTATQTEAVDRQAFVYAMRTVASSVTVVTSQGELGEFGATVSAFSSVSADPPTVLVCLNAQSRIAKAVLAHQTFCVNVLPEDAQLIADRFAGRHDQHIEHRFQNIELGPACAQGPTLRGATTFACQLDQVVPSASHLIMIGRVVEVFNQAAHPLKPLAYHNGGYQKIEHNPLNELSSLQPSSHHQATSSERANNADSQSLNLSTGSLS